MTKPVVVPSVKKAAPAAASPTLDLNRGLVAWWRCEGNGIDATGSHNGTLSAGIASIPGAVGEGLIFNGRDSFIFVEDAPDFRLTDSLSISVWLFVTSFPPANTYGQILFRGDNRPSLDPFFLAVTGGRKVHFEIGGPMREQVGCEADIPQGQFVHVGAVLDGASQTLFIYVDGRLAAQVKASFQPLGELDPAARAGIGIGNTQDPAAFNQPFFGIIDELRLYNRRLSQADIQELAKRPGVTR